MQLSLNSLVGVNASIIWLGKIYVHILARSIGPIFTEVYELKTAFQMFTKIWNSIISRLYTLSTLRDTGLQFRTASLCQIDSGGPTALAGGHKDFCARVVNSP